MPAMGPRASDVREMFGRIVPRYDLLNRVMSLGLDRRWRRIAARAAEPGGRRVLDLGTGTGDLAAELCRRGATVVGADFSAAMLHAARSKYPDAAGEPAGRSLQWVLADGLRLPFRAETFDCLTNAFVLRNLADLRAGLAEMARVLRPGGRLVCLDMTQPPGGVFGAAYRLYFHRLMPPLAGALSGDRAAYRYLPSSLTGFPSAERLAGLLTDVGFVRADVRLLGGGAVALHVARKRPRSE
jgi:demethylmenaquinone methyltransferase/2-methoxy-6-polyprenyl-1,4-benzoquinol methylase